MNEEPAVHIHQLVFRPDGVVEVTYSESRDQSETITVVKTLVFEARKQGPQVIGLLEDITDVVDQILINLRDDPETLPGTIRR